MPCRPPSRRIQRGARRCAIRCWTCRRSPSLPRMCFPKWNVPSRWRCYSRPGTVVSRFRPPALRSILRPTATGALPSHRLSHPSRRFHRPTAPTTAQTGMGSDTNDASSSAKANSAIRSSTPNWAVYSVVASSLARVTERLHAAPAAILCRRPVSMQPRLRTSFTGDPPPRIPVDPEIFEFGV